MNDHIADPHASDPRLDPTRPAPTGASARYPHDSAASDERVLAARRERVAAQVEGLPWRRDELPPDLVARLTRAAPPSELGDLLSYLRVALSDLRSAHAPGSPGHVAATVARDALGALWAVLP